MPDVDLLTYAAAVALAACGLLVLVLGLRMFRDGKGPDALPQTLAGAALIATALALPFAIEDAIGDAADAVSGLGAAGAGSLLFAAAVLLFASANGALSLRLILLERRRDGVLFFMAGLAAAVLAILLILQLGAAAEVADLTRP
jgi:hypothetical protein